MLWEVRGIVGCMDAECELAGRAKATVGHQDRSAYFAALLATLSYRLTVQVEKAAAAGGREWGASYADSPLLDKIEAAARRGDTHDAARYGELLIEQINDRSAS